MEKHRLYETHEILLQYTKESEEQQKMKAKKLLAIDIGNSRVKVVGLAATRSGAAQNLKLDSFAATCENPELNVLKGKLKVHITEGAEADDGLNQTICLDSGDTLLIANDKTERRFVPQTILAAAYRIYGAEVTDLEVAVGLPVEQYRSEYAYNKQMDKLKTCETIKGTVNGNEMCLNVRYFVYAEGYSALVAIGDEIDLEESRTIAIIDYGFRTTDVILADFIEDYWQPLSQTKTVGKGLYDVYDKISEIAIEEGLGVKLSVAEIQSRLQNQPIVRAKNKEYDLREAFKDPRLQSFVKEQIYAPIEAIIQEISARQVYVVGGNAEMMASVTPHNYISLIQDKKGNVDKETLQFANAIGYFYQLQGELENEC